MMGNGDLDGDVYWVCWDNELTKHVIPIPHKEAKEVAFESAKNDNIIKDICFVINKQNLGKICNM